MDEFYDTIDDFLVSEFKDWLAVEEAMHKKSYDFTLEYHTEDLNIYQKLLWPFIKRSVLPKPRKFELCREKEHLWRIYENMGLFKRKRTLFEMDLGPGNRYFGKDVITVKSFDIAWYAGPIERILREEMNLPCTIHVPGAFGNKLDYIFLVETSVHYSICRAIEALNR